MEITEVRIKLINNAEDRLRGFCSITFDGMFVVRDLKIIEGNNGPFVAMPSRKLTTNCYKCRTKNHLRANYCNNCGAKFKHQRIEHDSGGRAKLYADVAHPVNAKCREMIQKRVIEELERELELSRQPGYSSKYDDDYFDDDPGPQVEAANKQTPAKNSKVPSEPGQNATKSNPSESGDSNSSGDSKIQTDQATNPETDSKQTRVDAGSDNPQPPHNPDEGVADKSKSGDGEFGQGVFD